MQIMEVDLLFWFSSFIFDKSSNQLDNWPGKDEKTYVFASL